MATHRLTFFYDCLSPFSCWANVVVKRYAKIWPVEVQYRPFLLGGVMAATKNVPPAARPWSRSMEKISSQDMKRNQGYFSCSMLPIPTNFFGPDGPADKRGLARDMRYQRLLTAIQLEQPHSLAAATDHIFDIIHRGEQYRDDKGNVQLTDKLLEEVCVASGFSSEAASTLVQERIHADDVKQTLKNSTIEAVSKGAFGSPTFVISSLVDDESKSDVEDQVYFGSDRFEQMAWANGWAWVGPDPSNPIAKL